VGRKHKGHEHMGRLHTVDHKGSIRQRESTVADLPAVKVRGLAVRGIASGGVGLRAL
jgi:hypothetical protein